MKKIIDGIMQLDVISSKPPLLIDIGASGEIYAKWKDIAKYCFCIAFDADDRDFTAEVQEGQGYKKLYKINRIVSADAEETKTFYLTRSPHCSSTLRPDKQRLADWEFSPLFEVEREVTLPSILLNKAVESTGYDYIDWFKIDSQGTDLDIFLSLPDSIRSTILAADFEPGIIDAYVGEDKLYQVHKTIDNENMWFSSFTVKGTKRINHSYGNISNQLRTSPCWAELTALKKTGTQDLRSQLLLIVFSLIEEQWGFALEVIDKSALKDKILQNIKAEILNEIASASVFKRKFRSLLSKLGLR